MWPSPGTDWWSMFVALGWSLMSLERYHHWRTELLLYASFGILHGMFWYDSWLMECFMSRHIHALHRDFDDVTLLIIVLIYFLVSNYSALDGSFRHWFFFFCGIQLWGRFWLNPEHRMDLISYLRCDLIYYGQKKG